MPRRLFPYVFVILAAILPFAQPFLSNEIFVFRDHYDYFSPLRYFTAEQLSSGHLPLWNPYNGSGERWLANPQTGVFYPPTWVFLVVPFTRAYLLFLALHLIVLSVGAFVLFRRQVSTESAVMGAVLVTLGGPTLSLLDINNNLASFAWLPWILNGALDLRSGKPSGRIRSVLFLALAFLGGEPILAAVASVAFVVVALSGRRFARGPMVTVALIALVSMLLVSVQLLPFLELMRGSDRISGLASSTAFANSLHPRDWLSVAVAPRAPGTVFVFLKTSQRYIVSLYLGGFVLLGLMALVIGAPSLNGRIRRIVFFLVAVFTMIVMLAAGRFLPPLKDLMTAAHLNVSRYPARFAPFGAFSLVFLATIGLDRIKTFDRRHRVILVIATALAALVTYALFFPAEHSSILAVLAAMGSTGIVLIVLTAGPRLMRTEGWGYALAAVAAIDLLSAAGPLLMSARWDPTSPYEKIVDARTKLIRLPEAPLSNDRGNAPFEREQWLSGYLNLYLPRFDASTPAPVISRNYLRIHDAALFGPRFDLLDFLSARYLLTTRPLDPEGYRKVERAGSVQVYRSEQTLPMISLWMAAKGSSDENAALTTVLAPAFDARSEIVITGNEEPEERRASADSLKARIFRSEISPRGVVVDLYASGPILLSVNQLDAPGWSVKLNGREAVSLRANGIFRAVRIPAGTHHVVWSYQSRQMRKGAMLSALAIVLLAAEGAVLIRKRRARGFPSEASG